jgi:quercetin dioxygenase-like cupin family protein
MAIPHARPGEPIDVQPLGAGLPGAKTTALIKAEQLEVVHLVLAAGKGLPPHRVQGEITIHCIEGQLTVTHEGERRVLNAGQMLLLPAGALHGVEAVEAASALVTIVLPGRGAA